MIQIQATGLEKSFRTGQVLRGLDLNIEESTIYGLLGRNGAGKTTLLKILIGLWHPDQGIARVLGENLAVGCPKEKTRVAYVAQGEFLPAWARIKDLIQFESALRDAWQPASLFQWLDAENLSPKRRVHAMSVGQRKRLELELALACGPKVLLMDEPFAGLDPVSRSEFIEHLLDYIAREPVSLILSSHILTDLERLCDRIGVLARGVIAYEASLDALKETTAIITGQGTTLSDDLPCAGRLVASRHTGDSKTWIMSDLNLDQMGQAEAKGYAVSKGSLEDLGVELIRSLEPR